MMDPKPIRRRPLFRHWLFQMACAGRIGLLPAGGGLGRLSRLISAASDECKKLVAATAAWSISIDQAFKDKHIQRLSKLLEDPPRHIDDTLLHQVSVVTVLKLFDDFSD